MDGSHPRPRHPDPDEIGKNFSGAGMDTKVVNRGVHGSTIRGIRRFERLFLRGISEHSYGNGVGLGMADVVHDRLLEQIDWTPTQINSLTASTPAAIRTPIHFSSDRLCLQNDAHRGQAQYGGRNHRLDS